MREAVWSVFPRGTTSLEKKIAERGTFAKSSRDFFVVGSHSMLYNFMAWVLFASGKNILKRILHNSDPTFLGGQRGRAVKAVDC